mmetsp:Transcript_28065/g.60161  ORF Transcript_28065/g.60161 Transcript_28065/m.60161 type:complete len:435 (+) Transcript_28065:37-1341(+)
MSPHSASLSKTDDGTRRNKTKREVALALAPPTPRRAHRSINRDTEVIPSRRSTLMLCCFYRAALCYLLFVPPMVSMAMTTPARKHVSSSRSSSFSEKGRVELFFKSPSELRDRVRFLRSSGISSFNLVNKDKKDDVEAWIDSIREVYPEADVCAHYSLKHNKVPRKGNDEHGELLLKSLEGTGADEVLLVSGGGKKKAWNTVAALRALQTAADGRRRTSVGGKNNNSKNKNKNTAGVAFPNIAVAYNPYFPSRCDLDRENQRLKEKLATGCVSKIYLQFGTDPEALKNGLEFIRENSSNNNSNNNNNNNGSDAIAIAGSLFLPTKKLIAQQKFRPWNGVFLGDRFLNGPGEATAIVIETMKLYEAHNVEMLWEAPGIRTETDMDAVRELLAAASGVSPDDSKQNRTNHGTTTTGGPVAAKRPRRAAAGGTESRA